MRLKWITVIIIASIFSGGLCYFGYIAYQNAQTKYLREAIAYEGMTDYEEAAKSYEQHLLSHPNDFFAKYQYAMLLRTLNDEDKHIKLLCEIASELSGTVTPKERDKLRSKEGWKELFDGLFKAATNKTLEGDEWRTYLGDLRIILYGEDVYNNIFYNRKYKYSLDTLDTKETYKALEEIAGVQAKLAFIFWVEGNKEDVLDVIDLTPDTNLYLFDLSKPVGAGYESDEGFFTEFLEKKQMESIQNSQ